MIAKTAALAAGWDWAGPGLQLNRYCGSGLDAVNLAAQKIRSGWDDLIVAGGVESMSRMGIGAAPSVRDHQPRLSFELKMIPQGVSWRGWLRVTTVSAADERRPAAENPAP